MLLAAAMGRTQWLQPVRSFKLLRSPWPPLELSRTASWTTTRSRAWAPARASRSQSRRATPRMSWRQR
eukprot:8036505-Pyramimonas_sp.AAC.1